jgi:hypothetical protein
MASMAKAAAKLDVSMMKCAMAYHGGVKKLVTLA